MTSAVNQATKAAPGWAKCLGVIPLAVLLVASQVAMHEESQIFAAGAGVPTTSRSAPLSLKGKVFYVTDKQRRAHQAIQGAAFVYLAAFFGWMIWIRRQGRRMAPPAHTLGVEARVGNC